MMTLILDIHANLQQDVADCLRAHPAVENFTLGHVEGHGAQAITSSAISARDKVVGYAPRVRVEILLQDEEVQQTLALLRQQIIGISEHGVYWITPVLQHGQL